MTDVNDRELLSATPLQVLGFDAARDPFIAECVAVDVTSALRGAEVGLRALRQRALMRRLWESVTGSGNARIAAVGSDLIAVQRATLHVLWDIVGNEMRTWACLERVLQNLHAVNLDLDMVTKQTEELRIAIGQAQASISELEVRVSRLQEGLDREASLRRARDQYAAGMLHSGFGPLLRAALYVAYVNAHFSRGDEAICAEETRTAFGVVESSLSSEPRLVTVLATEEMARTEADSVESLVYITTRQSGPLCSVLSNGGKRHLAQLAITDESVRDAIALASVLEDPQDFLGRHVQRPITLVKQLFAEIST